MSPKGILPSRWRPEAVALIRALHYIALVLLFGGLAFQVLIARSAFRGLPSDHIAAARAFERGLLRLLAANLSLALVTGLAWLWWVAASMSGRSLMQAMSERLLSIVLTDTHFGQVWTLHLLLLAGVALPLLKVRRASAGEGLSAWLAGMLVSGAALAGLAWVGHVASSEEPLRALRLTADVLHLLAAGAWLGALAPLVYLLGLSASVHDGIAGEIARRFGMLGLASVSLLALTGIANAWFLVGSIQALLGSPYGRLLLAKLVLFLIMLLLAAYNRWWLTPALRSARSPGMAAAPTRALRRSAIAEAALGTGVLLIVGTLGMTPPAKHYMHGMRMHTSARGVPPPSVGAAPLSDGTGLRCYLDLDGHASLCPSYDFWIAYFLRR
jgi:putative copper resistance protein D